MAKKVELKTKRTRASVGAFIAAIEDKEQRADAKVLSQIMRRVTGYAPKMWGESIVGFGSYTYMRSNGAEGEFFATGFSPRKNTLSIYIMPGYRDYSALLANLGPHKTGASCLYIKRLQDIDHAVLESLIARGFADLKKNYSVK